jgi:hypothetical protein
MLRKPVEAAPKKAANSTQRVVSNYSATEIFLAFPQFQGKFQCIIQKGYGPPSLIMKAFNHNDSPQVADAISQSSP